jgi:hypothetical protein
MDWIQLLWTRSWTCGARNRQPSAADRQTDRQSRRVPDNVETCYLGYGSSKPCLTRALPVVAPVTCNRQTDIHTYIHTYIRTYVHSRHGMTYPSVARLTATAPDVIWYQFHRSVTVRLPFELSNGHNAAWMIKLWSDNSAAFFRPCSGLLRHAGSKYTGCFTNIITHIHSCVTEVKQQHFNDDKISDSTKTETVFIRLLSIVQGRSCNMYGRGSQPKAHLRFCVARVHFFIPSCIFET